MTSQRGEKFQGKFYNQDFSGRKLAHADFTNCSLIECNFTDAELRYSNFSGANCYGSNFTGANLYRAFMPNCVLERTIFKPRDCFGITLSLKCETFQNMEVDEHLFLSWMMIASLMKHPQPKPEEKSWLDKLILFIGADKYVGFKAGFNRRIL